MKKSRKSRTKMIIFFSFYLVFFLVLGMYLKNHQDGLDKKEEKETTSSIITIKDLFNHEFTYHFEVNDNGILQVFNGTKKLTNYHNFDNNYFLNYVNVNQLMKKSRVTTKEQLTTYYEIENKTLNELLNSDIGDGINEIKEFYGSSQNNYEYAIILDLTNYMGRNYIVTLKYMVGDKSE